MYIDYSPQAMKARIGTNKLNSVDWYGLRPNLWKGEGSDRKISKIGQFETDRILWIGIAAQSLVEKGKMEIIHWCGLDFMVVKG